MSIHADLIVARADHERRLELAGLDPYERHHHAEHRLGHRAPVWSGGSTRHPLAAWVARLVGGAAGRQAATRGPAGRHPVPGRPVATSTASGPRHP